MKHKGAAWALYALPLGDEVKLCAACRLACRPLPSCQHGWAACCLPHIPGHVPRLLSLGFDPFSSKTFRGECVIFAA